MINNKGYVEFDLNSIKIDSLLKINNLFKELGIELSINNIDINYEEIEFKSNMFEDILEYIRNYFKDKGSIMILPINDDDFLYNNDIIYLKVKYIKKNKRNSGENNEFNRKNRRKNK